MPATGKPPSAAAGGGGKPPGSRASAVGAAASARSRGGAGAGAISTAGSVRSGVATERVLRETFAQLSKGRSGLLPVNLIGQALRMNNQCPTEAELAKILEDYTDDEAVEADGEPKVDFDEFCAIMRENWRSRDQLLDEITAACDAFDKGQTGAQNIGELMVRLTSLGEVLDEAEVAEMVKDASAADGKVTNANLAKLLLDAYSRPASKKSAKKKQSAGLATNKSVGSRKSSRMQP